MYCNKKTLVSIIDKLLLKLNVQVNYVIIENDNKQDFLYVINKQNIIEFHVNFSRIKKRDLKTYLYHEIYHIKQFNKNFPVLLLSKDKGDYSIIQKIITDLYVTDQMIKDNIYSIAYRVFKKRLKGLCTNIESIQGIERIYKTAYIMAEWKIFFNKKIYIINTRRIKKVKKMFMNTKINKIFNILVKEYKNEDIMKMYDNLIKSMNTNVSVDILENKIIII